ncbi:sodium:proton antiporter [Candidatus Aquiluna sp. UB-MaderosW2red]|uniref:sodium:proton antiporter n=1 Tax=Candidatus Aquiluna sp. UB-MaderosW2red TaxID=1855377 RepID=UPI000875E033|nr:cation:proton antiporter subunit C [Candidatus Aquiluna sp. UB-MaderosW2red]SCX09875.1 multicomponent Na+:H+ antiporter subunit C [Candidatus Aquiluna sp. UB-MaderosW2red]
MSLALSIGFLAAAGVFLVLQRGMIRIILGFVLLTHAVNLLIIAAGGVARRDAPFADGDTSMAADPLPQAFVLTAIVIAFAITVVLATLAVVSKGDDDTEGEPQIRALDSDANNSEANNSQANNSEAKKGGDLK